MHASYIRGRFCSLGLSEFDHNGNDLQQWLKDADEKCMP